MLNLDGKVILVTGGLGFVGSNFIEMIMGKYSDMIVVNIDKRGFGSREYIPTIANGNEYHLVPTDIRLLNHMYLGNLTLPDVKYDYIFHFAAESHVDRSIESPSDFISNNVLGMTALLDYVKNHHPNSRLINISTDEVFGHLGLHDEPFTERSPFAPRSPYAASKASADLIANSYHTTFGLDIVTTHCCNNFGPHQADEKFIPTILRNLVKGNKIPVYGDGLNHREWIFVDDHNKSLLEIAEIGESGKSYNIGSGYETSNLYLIMDISNIFFDRLDGIGDIVEFVEDRKGHDFRYAIDSVEYERRFQLSSFHDSLRLTIDHYKAKYSK